MSKRVLIVDVAAGSIRQPSKHGYLHQAATSARCRLKNPANQAHRLIGEFAIHTHGTMFGQQ